MGNQLQDGEIMAAAWLSLLDDVTRLRVDKGCGGARAFVFFTTSQIGPNDRPGNGWIQTLLSLCDNCLMFSFTNVAGHGG